MARKPKGSSGSRLSNIMGLLRGNFDLDNTPNDVKPTSFGSPELISASAKSKILGRAVSVMEHRQTRHMSPSSVLGLVQTSLVKVGNERLENRKILQLMPEVDKAARLMISSSLSPTDLARKEIKIIFDDDSLDEVSANRLSEFATKFFQDKLNLKTSLPSWIYQFGYESGSTTLAIIPLKSFEKIEDDSFIGTETFISKVINPLCTESMFGFGDTHTSFKHHDREIIALENFAVDTIHNEMVHSDPSLKTAKLDKHISLDIVRKFLATEALSLTDNPSIMQVKQMAKEKTEQRTQKILSDRFVRPKSEMFVSISAEDTVKDKKSGPIGDPILLRLPPESVTIIHTPGDPSDHQGYLILLNRNGDPISSVSEEESANSRPVDYNSNQGNIFAQVYNAYGMTSGSRGISDQETMVRIYSQIVGEHIKNRLDKSGYGNAAVGNSDAVFRCMFARFLQSKQTRILFLPKELVTYMTFEKDQNGYGVSRLDRIKFNLGMKMAVQVSRVLASIKAAMDRRKIEVKFADNMMEQPELVFQSIVREYVAKNTMSFSIDPNVIQSQIADKSMSVKGVDMPGMETFDITNEPDARSGSVDFDPDILSYVDKSIMNGLRVPPATMNSLGEDEYARSVTTTNLFFSQDVSIDQDSIKLGANDLIRKYARYSEPFRNSLREKLPLLDDLDDGSISNKDPSEGRFNIDRLINTLSISLPTPSVAPSKAQFESLESMISAVTNMVNAVFPDDLMGTDDSLGPVIRLLRAKFTAINIRSYMETSGITGIEVPDTNFSLILKDISQLMNGLKNVSEMLKDKDKLSSEASSSSEPDYSSDFGDGNTAAPGDESNSNSDQDKIPSPNDEGY